MVIMQYTADFFVQEGVWEGGREGGRRGEGREGRREGGEGREERRREGHFTCRRLEYSRRRLCKFYMCTCT